LKTNCVAILILTMRKCLVKTSFHLTQLPCV